MAWELQAWEAAAVEAAFTKIGCWYVWGKSGPDTFDCMGLVQWAATEAGRYFSGDYNAEMMHAECKPLDTPEVGCLQYWLNGRGNAYHIGIVVRLDGPFVYVLGAHGGGSKCTSVAIAKSLLAHVSVKKFAISERHRWSSWSQ